MASPGLLRPAKVPCSTCPYRRDVPSGIWAADEYDKLPLFDGDVPDQIMAGATGLFHCHQRDGSLCAGWVACHDMENNLAVRLSMRLVDPAVFDYASPVPVFGSGAEAAEHGKRDLGAPGPGARRKIARLLRQRGKREG